MDENIIKSTFKKYQIKSNFILIGFFVLMYIIDSYYTQRASEISHEAWLFRTSGLGIPEVFIFIIIANTLVWQYMTKALTELFLLKNTESHAKDT